MTHADLIAEATDLQEGDPPTNIADALHIISLHGFADDEGGYGDAPCGHFYRVDRFVVVTNELGQSTVHEHEYVDEAERRFAALSEAFG